MKTVTLQPEKLQVGLWSLPVTSSIRGEDFAILSEGERQRAGRLHREHDRAAFMAARAALRRSLSVRLGQLPAAVHIKDDRGSKPTFPDLPPSTDVSLSHGPGRMLIAICDGARVGVDLELVAPFDLDLAETICSSNELAALAALPSHDRGRALTRLWTRKEAVTKAVGVGVAIDLKTLEVSLDVSPRLVRYDMEAVADWDMTCPPLGPAWETALAVEARARPWDLQIHSSL
jgi:4'-phosphopantetheinyl transferase